MRAKRWADKQSERARKAGVDTTAGAGADPDGMPAGAPKVVTTPYTSAPESPEQKARRAEGKPEPEPAVEPEPTPEPKPAPKSSSGRSGLLGFIIDGFGG